MTMILAARPIRFSRHNDQDVVERLLRDGDKLEATAMKAARSAVAELRGHILRGAQVGKLPPVKRILKTRLFQPLVRALAVGHAAGQRRSALLMEGKDTALSFDVFDPVLRVLRKQKKVDMDALQEQYSTHALKVLDEAGAAIEKKLRAKVSDLIAEGAHVGEATQELAATFDKLGIGTKSDSQVETIFRTQLQIAQNAGRWQEDQSEEIQEILWGYKYVTVGDDRVRPEHEALDGVTLPKDDDFWQTYWPPNGWNCRCQVIPIFEERKLKHPKEIEGEVPEPDEGFDFNAGEVFTLSMYFSGAWDEDLHPRDADGKFTSGGGGGDSSPAPAAPEIKEETKTPPPPGEHYKPSNEQLNSGTHARVGVPAAEVPPPPPIPRLPNLTSDERAAEESFASEYEKDPDGMATKFRDVMKAAAEARGKPDEAKVFETDAAKVLSGDWNSDDALEQAELRARYNTPLHQTANAITKRAFLQHLDTLPKGTEVLVTCGGCGAGKGYALGKIPEAIALKDRAGAVWDSAGDQNATENEWVLNAARERGLKVTYAFIHADPEQRWADPKSGVVQRANDPKNGRMVDAAVFADSYALGAQNHSAFHTKYAQSTTASFVFIDNSKGSPTLTHEVPADALKLNRDKLYEFATKTINEVDVRPAVRRGALVGQRIWQSAS
jgi:SPP1 gp7 family putative phage head morphogenesis protein